MQTKKTLDTGVGVARIAIILVVGGALILANACAGIDGQIDAQINDGCVTATLPAKYAGERSPS